MRHDRGNTDQQLVEYERRKRDLREREKRGEVTPEQFEAELSRIIEETGV